MQNIVIIANGAAYGSESLFNSLRLAIALRERKPSRFTPVLMSDAVTAGLRGQKTSRRLQYSANAGNSDRAKRTGKIMQNLCGRTWYHSPAAD